MAITLWKFIDDIPEVIKALVRITSDTTKNGFIYYGRNNMTWQIIAPNEINSTPVITEFSSQSTTIDMAIPNGGSIGALIANKHTQILPESATARSVYILNKGPGVVHLFIGTPTSAWIASPQSARKIQPGGSAESDESTCKAPLWGWSEGGAATLVIDILS